MHAGETIIEKPSETGLVIYGALIQRESADRLVCFMPSALMGTAARNPRQLSRMRWAAELPNQHVMALSDPAMGLDDEILACWYLHPTADLLEEMASMVSAEIACFGLPNEKVLFYGSSLGGFGALAMASLLPGSSAIAEVPQIDVAQWPKPSAIRAMERSVIGVSFEQFRISHPHSVDLRDRFKKSGLIPPFLLVTNTTDVSLEIQEDFMKEVRASDLKKIGQQKLLVTPRVSGHGSLSRNLAISLIEKWSEDAELTERGWLGLEPVE